MNPWRRPAEALQEIELWAPAVVEAKARSASVFLGTCWWTTSLHRLRDYPPGCGKIIDLDEITGPHWFPVELDASLKSQVYSGAHCPI